jgi:pimeloyl-ACP methyl ester carboxylesterase
MRSILIAVFGSLLSSALAQGADVATNMMPDHYAIAGKRVALDHHRSLNLRCTGKGEPVVILEAGGNADSSTWYRVQPQLAELTRVCAYDRARFGFSDGGPLPRDLDANVSDLRALIEAAKISRPVLLVGHSMGSNIVRRFAQRFPEQVVGLVLVDPPEQGADQQLPASWKAEMAPMIAQREDLLRQCEAAAKANDAKTLQERCVRQLPPFVGERVAAMMRANKAKLTCWRALRSEIATNEKLFAKPVPRTESYGAIPLLLLRPESQDEGVPDEVRKVLETARSLTHARILAASTKAKEIVVPNTSHDIQLDQPAAVVSAVRELLDDKLTSD